MRDMILLSLFSVSSSKNGYFEYVDWPIDKVTLSVYLYMLLIEFLLIAVQIYFRNVYSPHH